MSNTLNFPKPSHPDDATVHRSYMAAVRLLNARAEGKFSFCEDSYKALQSIHQLCGQTGYKSPITSEQLIEIQSDFA